MDTPLQVWFEFASTYSYPAVSRVEEVARGAGVTVEWRPFLLGPIFASQGWNDSPFNIYPVKGRYMWRDLERICARQGLPLRHPSRFPRGSLIAPRAALIAIDEGWAGDFIRSVYRANFAEDREIGDRAVVAEVIDSLGHPSADVLARAEAQVNKDRLRALTDDAIRIGIFGAPSIVVGDELFWGNDRLEEAVEFARQSR